MDLHSLRVIWRAARLGWRLVAGSASLGRFPVLLLSASTPLLCVRACFDPRFHVCGHVVLKFFPMIRPSFWCEDRKVP